MDDIRRISAYVNETHKKNRCNAKYNEVLKYVQEGLIKIYYFCTLFKKFQLCEGHAGKPEEFRVHIEFQLPHPQLVRIVKDKQNKGNVLIQLNDVLNKLKLENIEMFTFLSNMVNEKKCLLKHHVDRWLQGCFTTLIRANELENYQLKYCTKSPRHEIKTIDNTFNIIFIPVFIFEANTSITKRKISTQWEAIMDPMKDDVSFRTSYFHSEMQLFHNKNDMKSVLRMMQKFQSVKPLKNLDGYFLITLCLWIDEEDNRWNQPIHIYIRKMFVKLEKWLSSSKIPFFWDAEVNLLNHLTSPQKDNIKHNVIIARNILENGNSNKVAGIFLTDQEQKQLIDRTPTDQSMDELWQQISRVININSERSKYTERYNYVSLFVLNTLKKDVFFKILFRDTKLCGSYADNLKISKPNEFDLVLRFELPHSSLIKIKPDKINRGNVFIDLTQVMKKLLEDGNTGMIKFLKSKINEKNYFLQNKFQSWLEGLMTILEKENSQIRFTDNSIINLKYSKQGPAHTMDIKNGEYVFSVDFVPGFRFKASTSISQRKVTSEYWEAIPRPMKDCIDNPSFRTSYTESEREIISGRCQLKNTLRIMKKFRDMKPKLGNLKSYFLKTLFLWIHEKYGGAGMFWNQPTVVLIRIIFEELENALKKGGPGIPFFWDKKLNLLSKFKPAKVEAMYLEVVAARKILLDGNYQKKMHLFLTREEQQGVANESGTSRIQRDSMSSDLNESGSSRVQENSMSDDLNESGSSRLQRDSMSSDLSESGSSRVQENSMSDDLNKSGSSRIQYSLSNDLNESGASYIELDSFSNGLGATNMENYCDENFSSTNTPNTNSNVESSISPTTIAVGVGAVAAVCISLLLAYRNRRSNNN